MCQYGIINLLKPAGMTSHDAVSFLRKLTGIKRIGHTGTLDPMAVGVLPLCIGRATRIIEYLDLDFKSYRCELQLGIKTDTLDIWGEKDLQNSIDEKEVQKRNIDANRIKEVIGKLQGEIWQYPPKYSALKVEGKRLYEYARQNIDVEIKPRIVNIKSITLVRYDKEKCLITFDATCSKGTYIRSLCSEIGKELGIEATMTTLIRTSSGVFKLEDTVSVEALLNCFTEKENFLVNAKEYIYPITYPLVNLGIVIVNQDRGRWFLTGGYLENKDYTLIKKSKINEAYGVYTENNKFLGVAVLEDQCETLKAKKVFSVGAEFNCT